jgi:hypothetical protein
MVPQVRGASWTLTWADRTFTRGKQAAISGGLFLFTTAGEFVVGTREAFQRKIRIYGLRKNCG